MFLMDDQELKDYGRLLSASLRDPKLAEELFLERNPEDDDEEDDAEDD